MKELEKKENLEKLNDEKLEHVNGGAAHVFDLGEHNNFNFPKFPEEMKTKQNNEKEWNNIIKAKNELENIDFVKVKFL